MNRKQLLKLVLVYFKLLVLHFGLTGAAATWQGKLIISRVIIQIFSAQRTWAMCYYIAMVTKRITFEKLNRVLDRFVDAQLKLDLSKCEFAVKEVRYMGFIVIAKKGISVDLEKKRLQQKIRSILGPRQQFLTS